MSGYWVIIRSNFIYSTVNHLRLRFTVNHLSFVGKTWKKWIFEVPNVALDLCEMFETLFDQSTWVNLNDFKLLNSLTSFLNRSLNLSRIARIPGKCNSVQELKKNILMFVDRELRFKVVTLSSRWCIWCVREKKVIIQLLCIACGWFSAVKSIKKHLNLWIKWERERFDLNHLIWTISYGLAFKMLQMTSLVLI